MARANLKKLTYKTRLISLAKNIFLVFLNVTLTLATAGTIVAFFLYKNTPDPPALDLRDANQTSVIYDRTGTHTLYEIYGEENRKVIPREEIPDVIRITTVASEDNNFYQHKGIDLKAIIRAFKTNWENEDLSQGGSTITQQLARNVYLSREKTLRRKIMEIILAIKIEKKYSKDQILDMYLNVVPYGSNAYGIEAASEIFFRKNAKNLTLDEAAILSVLPRATTYYSPYGEHINELVSRQQWILNRIAERNLYDLNSIEEAKKTLTLTKIFPAQTRLDSPHFVFYVRNILENQWGRETLKRGGLKIYTTLDYDMQKLAEKTVIQGARKNSTYNAENAALISLDPKTGQILAMAGSRDYFDTKIDGEVNVTTRPRQPGSSFKPFAYSAAFLKGYEPETLIADTPTNFGPDGSGKSYIPKNYDGKFHGIVSMRQALAMSLNIPAVKTLYLAGIDNTIELAKNMGITTLNEKNRYGLSLVLGGGAVTLLDETAGYSVFANDGKRNPVSPILKIEDSYKRMIYRSTSQNKLVLDPQVARKINSILSDNNARIPIFGSNNKLHILGRAVAAKTGTSQEFRDGWTIGYTPNLAVGVWVGNNDNSPMRPGADGSYVAAPIWNDFMSQTLKNYPDETFIAYDKQTEKESLPLRKNAIKISYYNKETGKKLSEKKKNKTDPKKIETRIEFSEDYTEVNFPASVEFQDSEDPMIQKWKQSLTKNVQL